MKITGPDSLQKPQPGKTTSPESLGRPSNFGDMFRETLGRSDTSGTVQSPSSLQEPQAVHNVQQVLQSDSLTDRASSAVDLLDSYSKALADPRKTLRDIEPQLTAFIDKAQALYDEYHEKNHLDPNLKSVLEELVRTARVEEVRFQRGDYLDTE